MDSPTEAPAPPDESARLNGWKEIAGHLGKGVRTVQRWERDYGLPVRRIGREGGEIVFALKHEIDRWSLDADTLRDDSTADEPAPIPAEIKPAIDPTYNARRVLQRNWPSIGAATLVVLSVTALGFRATGIAVPQQPNPSQATVDTRALRVSGTDGSLLWEYALDFEPNVATYQPKGDGYGGDDPLLIDDLDGDGLNEVLFTRRPARRNDRHGLTVLNHDGSERFTVAPSPTPRFGVTDYAGPWMTYRMFVTRNLDGTRSVWVAFIHGMWFPTLLMEIDARGHTKSSYWSAGYIESVTTATWREKPVIFVGGTHNDSRGASLAIFEAGKVSGSSPAMRDAYKCGNCEGAGPMEFLLFPRLAIARAVDGQATVLETWVDGADGLHILAGDGPEARSTTGAWYSVTQGFELGKVEFSGGTKLVHDRLFRDGATARPFDQQDLGDARPLRWDGRSFVEIPRSVQPRPIASQSTGHPGLAAGHTPHNAT